MKASKFFLASVLLSVSLCLTALARQQQENKATVKAATPSPAVELVSVRALTKEELEKWAILSNAEKVYNETIITIVGQAVGAQVEADNSRKFHTAIKEAFNLLSLSVAERKAFVWQLRSESNCKDCLISDDGKLVKPAETAKR